jgi:hypothetical protein
MTLPPEGDYGSVWRFLAHSMRSRMSCFAWSASTSTAAGLPAHKCQIALIARWSTSLMTWGSAGELVVEYFPFQPLGKGRHSFESGGFASFPCRGNCVGAFANAFILSLIASPIGSYVKSLIASITTAAFSPSMPPRSDQVQEKNAAVNGRKHHAFAVLVADGLPLGVLEGHGYWDVWREFHDFSWRAGLGHWITSIS